MQGPVKDIIGVSSLSELIARGERLSAPR